MFPISKKISIGAAVFLLLAQFIFQLHLAREDSQTTDEGIHIYAGYRYLVHGDFSYNPEHPPLVKYLAAFPLLFMDLNEPARYENYAKKTSNFFFWGDPEQSVVAEDFLYNSGNDASKILFWSRVPMTFLTMLLGILVFGIAAFAFGWGGGLLALFVYVIDPTITGHGHLVTTDIGFAAGALLSLFALWRFLEQRSIKRAVWFGVAVGIMLLTKYSALLMGPVFLVLIIWYLYSKKSEFNIPEIRHFVQRLLLAGIIAWIVLIAGYRFQLAPPPLERSVVQVAKEANNIEHPWVPDTTLVNNTYNSVRYVMVPGDYFRGLVSFLNHATAGHHSYLFGEQSVKGWWYYFPVLFSAKLFILVIGLFVLSLAAVWKNRKIKPIGAFFLLAFVLYFASSMTSNVNIGVRHVMLAFPLMCILIGGLAAYPFRSLRSAIITIAAIVMLLIIEFVSIYPFYLSYFNQLYGGSFNGYKTAVDSNLDWGQDLYRIQEYMTTLPSDEKVYLDYFWAGTSALRHYDIPFEYLSNFDKEKDHGFIIIAATPLIQDHYAWLREYPIYDQITPSVFVYKPSLVQQRQNR